MIQKFLFALILVLPMQSFSLVVVGHESEPYYFKSGSEGLSGICYELIQSFCQKEGLHCKFKIAPLPQSLEMLRTGKADVTCPLAETPARKKFLRFSGDIFKAQYAFYGVPEIAKKIKSFEDLQGVTVGVYSPSRTSLSLTELRKKTPVKFEIIKETSQISALLRAEKVNKVLAYINRDLAEAWIEKSHSTLIQAPLAGDEVLYKVAFAKKAVSEKKSQAYAKTFNELINSKDVQVMAEKYRIQFWGVTPPTPAKPLVSEEALAAPKTETTPPEKEKAPKEVPEGQKSKTNSLD